MFQLMLKDIVCAEFDLTDDLVTEVENLRVIGTLPVGCTEDRFLVWLNKRNAAKHRKHLSNYLSAMGANNTKGFLVLTHGISLNDCYWIKDSKENVEWRSVSPYTNEYDTVIQKLAFEGAGLYGEQFSSTSPEFGTSGAFDKCWVREDDKIFLVKRGSDVASNSGLEPYGEVLASQVFNAMHAGIPYKLIEYHNKTASKCKLFNDEDRSFVCYGNMANDGSFKRMINFYDSLGSDIFRRILVCDALTLNTDRHLGNHGVFVDPLTQKVIGSAPGYDYNLSMCPYLTSDDFVRFDDHFVEYAPKMGGNFISMAKEVMTPAIRRDLINLKGIKLELPFYTERFTEERCGWLTELVNTQIDNILIDRTPVIPKFKVSNVSNCMKYRMKFNMNEETWLNEVPRLMKVFGIAHMEELEREIVKLL